MTAPHTLAAATALTALLMTPMTTLRPRPRKAAPCCCPCRTTRRSAFRVWFKVGSQDDPPGKEGLAYLTGQLISQGATTANSYEEILEKLYPLAAGYGVRVDTRDDGAQRPHPQGQPRRLLRPVHRRLPEARLHAGGLRAAALRPLNYLEKTLRYASDEELGKAALMSFVFDGTRLRAIRRRGRCRA